MPPAVQIYIRSAGHWTRSSCVGKNHDAASNAPAIGVYGVGAIQSRFR